MREEKKSKIPMTELKVSKGVWGWGGFTAVEVGKRGGILPLMALKKGKVVDISELTRKGKNKWRGG